MTNTGVKKIWSFLLFFSSLLWFFDSIAVWFGYKPSTLSLSIAFLFTAVVVLKWSYEVFVESEK